MITYHALHMALYMVLSIPVIIIARLIFHAVAKHRLKQLNWLHEAGIVILFAIIAGVASQTLQFSFMTSENELSVNFIPFKWLTGITELLQVGLFWESVKGAIGNVLMFIPIGFLLPLVWSKQEKFRVLLLSGFSISLTIEIIQLAIPFRATDIDDLILNTLGAVVGYLVYLLVKKLTGNRTDKFKLLVKDAENPQ